MTVDPIPAEHNGIMYRSRTEARWAVFFESAGISFSYEAEGFDMDGIRYLPDFWLPVGKCWFEVKPFIPLPEEISKGLALAKATRRMVFIAPGEPRKGIGLYALSPSGKMQKDWKFAYAHEQGVGYICDNLWKNSHAIKIADVTGQPGMYGGIGPDDELERAGGHQFPWKRSGRFHQDGDAGHVPGRSISRDRPASGRVIQAGRADMRVMRGGVRRRMVGDYSC
jgi:hypothetical protein